MFFTVARDEVPDHLIIEAETTHQHVGRAIFKIWPVEATIMSASSSLT
jgi:hypothetical protein